MRLLAIASAITILTIAVAHELFTMRADWAVALSILTVASGVVTMAIVLRESTTGRSARALPADAGFPRTSADPYRGSRYVP